MVSLDIGGVEGQLREHEASRQAVSELLKFAQNEADSIMSKIKEQVRVVWMRCRQVNSTILVYVTVLKGDRFSSSTSLRAKSDT